MRSRRGEIVLLAALFAAATIVWTWPIVTMPGRAYLQPVAAPNILQQADIQLTTWMIAWTGHALRTNPLGLFDANIFQPLPWTLAFSEHLIASALLVLPVDVAFGNPVLDHNVLLLATFVLGGVGTALLLRELGASLLPAALGGALFVFTPFRLSSLMHVQVLSAQWMPFTLLALHRLLSTGRRRAAVALGVCLALEALSCVYYLYFFGAALGVFLVLHWALRCPAAPGARRAAWIAIALAASCVGALMLPYLHAREVYSLTRITNQARFLALPAIVFFGGILQPLASPYEARTMFGLGAIVLGIAGLAGGARTAGGERRTPLLYLAVALTGIFLALGPRMCLYSPWAAGVPGPWALLAQVVPGWSALRAPARATSVALLGLAVLAGLGADWLVRLAPGRLGRGVVCAVLAAIVLHESWRTPPHAIPVPWRGEAPAVYRWLAAQPADRAVLDLPLGIPSVDARAMVLSAYHWKRLVNGYSGFAPTARFNRRLAFTFPSDESLRTLDAIDVETVVVHTADALPAHKSLCTLPPAQLPPALRRVYQDDSSCVLAIVAVPPAPPRPTDRPVPLAGATTATSDGSDASSVIDGDAGTHWVQAVTKSAPGWLVVNLPAEHRPSRIVLRLGSHFGEYLREYEVQVSTDGAAWTTVRAERFALPPLRDIQHRPDDLRMEILLDPQEVAPASHVRLVRPTTSDAGDDLDLWPTWPVWGMHEIELYE